MQKPLFVYFFLLFTFTSSAQVEGLWEVTQVTIADEVMTPVAKWFDLKADGVSLSGNGGVINQRGSWTYEANKKALLFKLPDGTPDPAGAFTLSKDGEDMIWQRKEEGMPVRVLLKPIEVLPLASWDLIAGAWQLDKIMMDGSDVSDQKDPDRKYNLFVRWDHLFVARNDLKGRKQQWGVWQIHAHKSELRMMPLNEEEPQELWQIKKIDDHQLVLQRKTNEQEEIRVFKRTTD